jgi:hypothetical protein
MENTQHIDRNKNNFISQLNSQSLTQKKKQHTTGSPPVGAGLRWEVPGRGIRPERNGERLPTRLYPNDICFLDPSVVVSLRVASSSVTCLLSACLADLFVSSHKTAAAAIGGLVKKRRETSTE